VEFYEGSYFTVVLGVGPGPRRYLAATHRFGDTSDRRMFFQRYNLAGW